jgi:hypothetical protein
MIRPELQPPQRDRETIDRLTELAEQVVAAVDSGVPYAGLIAQFNAATHSSFTVGDFMGAAGSITMREFTRGALMPEPRRVPGVTRDDLLEIIRHVRGERRAGLLSESELGYWIQFLEANIPNPRILDLLFHSEHLQTAEQVLDEASRYRPFAMPAPND